MRSTARHWRSLLLAPLLAAPAARAQHSAIALGGRTLLPSDTTAERRSLVSRRDVARFGTVVLVTASAFAVDRAVAEAQRDHPAALYRTLDGAAQANRLGWVTRPGVWFISAATFGVGRLSDDVNLADLGIHSLEAVGAAFAATGGIKMLSGRAQPVSVGDTLYRDFKLGGGFGRFARQSFPSGEASIAFAMASSVTAEVHRAWPRATLAVAPLMYGGATAVAASRLNVNRHWLSDIVFGAGLGTLTGLKVVEYAHAHPDNALDRLLLAVRVAPTRGGGGVLALSFDTR